MAVDIAIDGDDGYRKAVLTRYDVVVLDRDLPGMSGDEICRRLSDEGVLTRVLMLTASGTVEDKVAGLALGPTTTWPSHLLSQLVAQVRELGLTRHQPRRRCSRQGDQALDSARRIVTRGGEVIELTRKEFGVLETLLTAQGAVVSSEGLLDRVWDGTRPVHHHRPGHHDDPAAKTRRTSHHRYGGGLGLSHRSWRARAVRRGGRIGSVRILRPTLRIRMALLYGGLVLLVGVSLLVLALLLLDRAVGNLGIFANGEGTATITVNGHVVYSGPTRGSSLRPGKTPVTTSSIPASILLRPSRCHRCAGRLSAGEAGPSPDCQGHPHGPAAVDRHARPAHQPGWSGRRAARAGGHLRRDAGPPRCRLRQPATVRGQRGVTSCGLRCR